MGAKSLSERAIELTFRAFVAAAIKGERCPVNDVAGVRSDAAVMLAHHGRIEIRISGHNWRTAMILDGPHAGRSTMADPAGGRVYKIIDASGTHMIRRAEQALQGRARPLLPRLLLAGKSGTL